MIITNSTIITWDNENPLIENSDIVIIEDKIMDIGITKDIRDKYSAEEVFDAHGKILMPGMICAHTHFYGLFSRGLGIPGEPPGNFSQILEKLWWPLDSSLTEDDVKYSALVCLLDAIKHGTTTLFDHHASTLCIEGSLDIISDCFETMGVRGVVCYETTDRYGIPNRDKSINENLRMIKKVGKDHPLINAMFGIHAGLTVSDETLEIIKNSLPDNVGVHIHAAEDKIDETDSIQKSGMRVIERLHKFNLLGKNSVIAHGVHLDQREMELINKTQTWISHQPRSNMNNAVGMAKIEEMIDMGIKVCLGNDGFSNAMWDEWRTCYLVHKLTNADPQAMNGNMVIQIAAQNNANLTSHFYRNKKIGRLKPGYQADLILVDYDPITELNKFNIPWHILFGFRDSMVTDTMVNGKWLMNSRIVNGIDEKEISEKALALSKDVWKRYIKKF